MQIGMNRWISRLGIFWRNSEEKMKLIRGKNMKKLIFIIIVLSLFMVGCSNPATNNPGTNNGGNPTTPGGDQPDNPNNGGEHEGGEETQIDQAVKAVNDLIAALPNANDITAANKATVQAQIDAIEAAYAELTAEQKQQVTNYSKVTAAKNKITEIENALNQQQNQFPEPTTSTLGDYTMYDFVQNNTIQYGSPLEEMELYYLQKAEGYIQNNLNALSNSAKQNATISNAINYYNQNAKKHYQEGTYTDIGAAHNETQKAFAPIYQKILEKQEMPIERETFEICYRILANEAYKYGLGTTVSTHPTMTRYNNEKTALINLSEGNAYLEYKNINVATVYSSGNFNSIVSLFNELSSKVVNNNVTQADLVKINNIAFITEAEQALCIQANLAGLGATATNEEIINTMEQTIDRLDVNEMGM